MPKPLENGKHFGFKPNEKLQLMLIKQYFRLQQHLF